MSVYFTSYKLLTQPAYVEAKCRFLERLQQNKQNTYEAMTCGGHGGCYLNLNRKGLTGPVHTVNHRSKQAQFLPLNPNHKEQRYRRHSSLRHHRVKLRANQLLLFITAAAAAADSAGSEAYVVVAYRKSATTW